MFWQLIPLAFLILLGGATAIDDTISSAKSGYVGDALEPLVALPEWSNSSYAFTVKDMDGDGGRDVLLITTINSLQANCTEISARNGAVGDLMWSITFTESQVYAYPVGDVNGDGLEDVLVDVAMGNQFLPQSEVMVVYGANGTEIWKRSRIFGLIGIAYPLPDRNGDRASEILVDEIFFDLQNNSLCTEISVLSGSDGSVLEAKSFPGSMALQYPGGNLTDDDLEDYLVVSLTFEAAPLPWIDPTISSQVIAMDGSGDGAIWEKSFKDAWALAIPGPDMGGDGLDDVLIYRFKMTAPEFKEKVQAVNGNDGRQLWAKTFSCFSLAMPTGDLNGDGIDDLLFYQMEMNMSSFQDSSQGGLELVDGFDLEDGDLLGIGIPREGIDFINMMGSSKPEEEPSVDEEVGGNMSVLAVDGRLGKDLWKGNALFLLDL